MSTSEMLDRMSTHKQRTDSLDEISIESGRTDESSKSASCDDDDFEISSSKSSIRDLVVHRPSIGSLRAASCCSLSNSTIYLQAFSGTSTIPKSASAVNCCYNTLTKSERSSPISSSKLEYRDSGRYTENALYKFDVDELRHITKNLQKDVGFMNDRLIKAVKLRAHEKYRQESKCNIITALLQAVSEKKFEHTKLQFALHPPASDIAFHYWLNTMRALTRLHDGIPGQFRANLWIALANYYLKIARINWSQVRQTAFSNTINPDDDRLSLQILKDLHRTGWPGFSEEAEKVHLKRVLLGYARYNRSIRYCQGFNVIAALLSEVTALNDEETLKVLIFLLEYALPHGYFDQNLRGLSVDMSVIRILLHEKLPQVAVHLDDLQKTSKSDYEPPLENVFSMQWFLTLFATCLPKKCVYRIIDAIMLDGSEIILKAALVIWAKLSRKILRAKTANDFYCMMDIHCKKMLHLHSEEINGFIQAIYSMEDLTAASIEQLRENVHWNIQPFTPTAKMSQKRKISVKPIYNLEESDYTKVIPCLSCKTSYYPERHITKLVKMNLSILKKKYKERIKIQEKAFLKMQAVNESDTKSLCSVQLANTPMVGNTDQIQMLNWTTYDDTIGRDSPAFFEISRYDNSSVYVTLNGTVPVKPFAIQPKIFEDPWIN